MAYLGHLRTENNGPVFGWACDYCGVKAESSKKPPEEWRSCEKYTLNIQPLTYTTDELYCSKRCCALYNHKSWPPVKALRTDAALR